MKKYKIILKVMLQIYGELWRKKDLTIVLQNCNFQLCIVWPRIVMKFNIQT